MAVYVRRRGRFTPGQKRALDQLADRYVLATDAIPTLSAERPIGVEIGFGMGHALLEWARVEPDWQLLGIDVYQPGIGSLMAKLEAESLPNVRAVEADAEPCVRELFATGSVREFRILFPDPWPKKRHAKRRLIQPDFAKHIARSLEMGGCLRLATDWQPYAEWMMAVLSAEPTLQNSSGVGCFATGDVARPHTRFEDRGLRLGHDIWDMTFEKIAEPVFENSCSEPK